MKMTALLTLLALTAAPGIAAACSSHQAMSCAEGQTYDSETHACVPGTTS